jgi:serine/threonine protein phosphatase PrpC
MRARPLIPSQAQPRNFHATPAAISHARPADPFTISWRSAKPATLSSMPEARAQHPTLAIRAAGATDIGRARSHNEDAVLVRPDLRLWVVADGAGGHNAGNVASALAVATVTNHFESGERAAAGAPDVDRFGIPLGARRLSAAIRKANHDIVEISKSAQKYGGMGSTIVAVTVAARSSVLYVAHVGDSRCYRLRAGRLERLTQDHSLLNDVIEMHPDLADEAIAKLPRKVVTRALGMEEAVRVTVRPFDIVPEDVVLLCSDGLTGELAEEQIRRILTLPEPPAELVERLLRMANEAGGGDNIAAVVLAFDVTSTPGTRMALEPALELDPLPDTEPAPTRKSPPPARGQSVSAPEILLLGIESEVDLEEAIRVVPSSSASSGLCHALGDLLPTRRSRAVQPPCASCGGEIVGEAFFCPRCGVRLAEG